MFHRCSKGGPKEGHCNTGSEQPKEDDDHPPNEAIAQMRERDSL